MWDPTRLVDAREMDQLVVLRGLSWAHYDAIDFARGEAARPRLAYLDGELEIMTTGRQHEYEKKMIARLLEAYAEESNVELNAFGNETYWRAEAEAGLEPDECYCVGDEKEIPDLAVEVVKTSGGVDKLEIYRRIGVREVWFFVEERFQVFRLTGSVYRRMKRSSAVRGIDLGEIARLVRTTDRSKQTRAVKAYRRALQRRSSR